MHAAVGRQACYFSWAFLSKQFAVWGKSSLTAETVVTNHCVFWNETVICIRVRMSWKRLVSIKTFYLDLYQKCRRCCFIYDKRVRPVLPLSEGGGGGAHPLLISLTMCGLFMTGHTMGFRCAIGHIDCTLSEFHVSVDVTGRSTFQCLPRFPTAKDPVETHNATSYTESARFRSRAVSTVIPRLTKIIRSGITFVSRNVISPRFL